MFMFFNYSFSRFQFNTHIAINTEIRVFSTHFSFVVEYIYWHLTHNCRPTVA